MFIKEVGGPKLSEPCLAKFLTIITNMDNPDATYTADERLGHLHTFKEYMANAMSAGTSRVVDMPTTPEEFKVTHPMWYAKLYWHEWPVPSKLERREVMHIQAKHACRTTKLGSALQRSRSVLDLTQPVRQPVINRGV